MALLSLRATDSAGLLEVTGEIHDWYFDTDDIAFDPLAAELAIPFRRWSYEEARVVAVDPPRRTWLGLGPPLPVDRRGRTWTAPWYRWYLRIRGVRRYSVDDEAEIGLADFDQITCSEGTLRIECNIPVTILVHVSTVDVQLEETANRLGYARYHSTEGAMSYDGHVLADPPVRADLAAGRTVSLEEIPEKYG